MKTPEEYKESLRKMRPNIYKFGELITDTTTHPATRRCIEGHAKIYEAAQNPDYRDLLVTTSHLTGEKISRYLSLIKNAKDMIENSKLKRTMFNLTGTCTGGRCVGWTAINADPKGNRALPPSKQDDPDMYLHAVEENDNGIVVRGAKVMIAGVAAANEIFVLPGMRYREPDKDYAVSFVIPKDIKGLTIIEATHPSDRRELEEKGFDIPTETGITQSYLFFEDVLVPEERVFMCKEYRYSFDAVWNFIMPYRSAIGGCVAGQGDVMIGAATLAARANGLSENVFRGKLTKMVINNETTFGMGIAAAAMGKRHPSGIWLCNPLLSNVNKIYVASLPYETKVITQDICGGIGETGCMPSSADFFHEKYGRIVQKYLKAAASAETRARIARLVEWLTVGAGIPGCMHGGGSPEGARLIVWKETDLDRFISLAKDLAGVEEETLPPKK